MLSASVTLTSFLWQEVQVSVLELYSFAHFNAHSRTFISVKSLSFLIRQGRNASIALNINLLLKSPDAIHLLHGDATFIAKET